MTDFNIYCDESRHTSDPTQPFMVIGGVRCPRDRKHDLVGQIHRLQARHNAHGELGWKRVSPNKAAFYEELLALFANTPDLSFRCIVADRNKLDHDKFNGGDAELGFYKLYYQMLVHWLEKGQTYHIYLDWQQNQAQHRFHDLAQVLTNKLRDHAGIACLDPVHDVPLSLARLQRIRWIKLALAGEGVRIDVLAQTRQDSRGRMKRRRSLIVLDNRYVVVLEPSEDDGFDFVFITAFPADQSYLDRIRRGANVVERRGQK